MNEDFSQTPKADRASLAGKFHARFQRYRNLLLRRWWVLVLAAVAAGGLQYWRLSHALPVFQSVGQMIVNIKLNISQNALYSEELGNFLGTQAALMQGKTVLNHARERVATENPGLAPQSVAVDVSVLPKTTIFVLRGTATEPVYAQKFLQACMEEYISLKKEMAAHTSDTTIAGLTEQIQKIEPEITKIDDQIAEYLRTNDAVLLAESGVMNTFLGTLYQRGADAQSQFDMLNSMTLDQSLLLLPRVYSRDEAPFPFRAFHDLIVLGCQLFTRRRKTNLHGASFHLRADFDYGFFCAVGLREFRFAYSLKRDFRLYRANPA